MKSCDDMVNSLLERKEQYEIDRKRKNKILIGTIVPLCCVCLVTLIGVGAWHGGLFGNKPPVGSAEDAVIPGIKDTFGPGESESHSAVSENLTIEIASEPTESQNAIAGVGSQNTIAQGSLGTTTPTIGIASGDVWIYYVSGDKLEREQVRIDLAPKEVFRVWKEKNGIGDEVKFIKVDIKDNGKEINNGSTVGYQVGDYFIFNLTVSKEIENYYEKTDSALLLESLKESMMNYSYAEYDEYHLFLE